MRSWLEWFCRGSRGPIGIDIGHNCVRMIQLGFKEGLIRAESAEQEPLEAASGGGSDVHRTGVVRAIRAMLARGRFWGREAVSCLPGDALKIKSLRLDALETERLEEGHYGELAQRFGLDPDKDEIRYLIAGSVYQGEEIRKEVIFFGMNRTQLMGHVSLLEEAGLEPIAVDAMPCALFRSFRRTLRRQEDREVVSVLVNLGMYFTTVIIGRGTSISLVKQIPLAEQHLTQKAADVLGVSWEEAARQIAQDWTGVRTGADSPIQQTLSSAMSRTIEDLAREISLCFKYYAVAFRGERPSEVVFAGGRLYESLLMDLLREQLNLDIRIAEPLRGIDLRNVSFDRRPNPQMAEWAVAVGLALKGWSQPGLQELDNVLREKAAV
ncbi:MAG TPA: pilus assembly protein PilM [Anaerohalosphaeraceae bacterium]|nr:pilus assembly protein PilM [Anaerohalosphaeraceae bacterium]